MTAPTTPRTRVPVLLTVDVSSSMAPLLDTIEEAVTAALDAAWSAAVEPVDALVGVITVGSEASLARSLGPVAEPGEVAVIAGEGTADIDGAIDLMASEHERVTVDDLAGATRLARPWVLFVTDGRWARGDVDAAIARLHGPPTPPIVHPVGVGDVDETALARLATHGGVVVGTPADLSGTLRQLVTDLVRRTAAGASDWELDAPPGTRHLEGW